MFQRQGLQGLLKDGGRHFVGHEARLGNIEAVVKLSSILKTSMGPNSMQKMIVNHIDKLFVTSDAATIVEQLDVQHPAAKTVIQAAQMQAQEFSDNTNFVMVFAGELLYQAGELIKEGVHIVDIVKGFQLCLAEAEKHIEKLSVKEFADLTSVEALSEVAFSALSSKVTSSAAFFARLVGRASSLIIDKDFRRFKVESVRTIKISGGSLRDSSVVHGLVLERPLTSVLKEKFCTDETPLKVLVLSCDLAQAATDTTGNVLLNNSEDLMGFCKEEDIKMKEFIIKCKDQGVQAIIVGGHIADVAQHFCDDMGMVTCKIQSKFELRRLCKTFGCPAMSKLLVPNAEEVGVAKSIKETEIGSSPVVVIEAVDSSCSTIVIRGATSTTMDEVERAIDDALGAINSCHKDTRFTTGGGAVDVALSVAVDNFASTQLGLEQYGCKAFAQALLVVPSILIENTGLNKATTLSSLLNEHKQGKSTVGVTLDPFTTTGCGYASLYNDNAEWKDNVISHLVSKKWALKFATHAANNVLSVDQIIMTKPAGGPKFPSQGHWDAQDDKQPIDTGY